MLVIMSISCYIGSTFLYLSCTICNSSCGIRNYFICTFCYCITSIFNCTSDSSTRCLCSISHILTSSFGMICYIVTSIINGSINMFSSSICMPMSHFTPGRKYAHRMPEIAASSPERIHT